MENLIQDSSFQAGYRVAKYLEENPCDQPACEGENCAECIAYAVEMVEYEITAEAKAQTHKATATVRQSRILQSHWALRKERQLFRRFLNQDPSV